MDKHTISPPMWRHKSGKSDMKLAGNMCKMHFVEAKMCSPPNTKMIFPRQSDAALVKEINIKYLRLLT